MSEEQEIYGTTPPGISKIGTRTLHYASSLALSLMMDWQQKIDEAYRKADGALTVNLSLKFSPFGNGANVDAGISFVAEKVQDKTSGQIDEAQMEMFEDETRTGDVDSDELP